MSVLVINCFLAYGIFHKIRFDTPQNSEQVKLIKLMIQLL